MRKHQGVDRRLVVTGGLAVGFTLGSPAILRAQDAGDALVECAQGKLRGIRGAGLSTFKGVPYAGDVYKRQGE